MTSDAMLTTDLPLERLERIHYVVASRILERNESEQGSNDGALTRTLDLDRELQQAARSLPSKWWLTPRLDDDLADSQALFWSTRRLFAQMLHYNLLNQLHLPYMLRSSAADRKHHYEYSRTTCVTASREMLARFIVLRSFHGMASSCRIVDFLSLMAAMTLLLAHLDSHSSGSDNPLSHQYHSDRAMIENVHENMKQDNRANSDALSAHIADLLGRLLSMEAETTNDHPRSTMDVSMHDAGGDEAPPDQDDDAAVTVHVPYFGMIKVARKGVSLQGPSPPLTSAPTSHQPQYSTPNKYSTSSTASTSSSLADPLFPPRIPSRTGLSSVGTMTPDDAGCGQSDTTTMLDMCTKAQMQSAYSSSAMSLDNMAAQYASSFQPSLPDPLLPQTEYPGLAAGSDDWAFQGVDLAFFDSLMGGVGNEMEPG